MSLGRGEVVVCIRSRLRTQLPKSASPSLPPPTPQCIESGGKCILLATPEGGEEEGERATNASPGRRSLCNGEWGGGLICLLLLLSPFLVPLDCKVQPPPPSPLSREEERKSGISGLIWRPSHNEVSSWPSSLFPFRSANGKWKNLSLSLSSLFVHRSEAVALKVPKQGKEDGGGFEAAARS